MSIVIAIISIFILIGVVWLINKIFSVKICHVCVGVALTWAWLIIARFLGYDVDVLVPAILMGGSVVGFAYWIEKHRTLRYSSIAWKILFISIGFIVAYSLISLWWIVFFVAVVLLALLTALFLRPRVGIKNKKEEIILALEALSSKARKADLEESKTQKLDIEKEMEDCC